MTAINAPIGVSSAGAAVEEPERLVVGLDGTGRARISTQVYTSPNVFETEMDRVFRRSWVYIGHESQLREPGDYLTTRVGNLPVILTRDEDGGLHVLINRCIHRGVTVCLDRAGNANYFRCQYHGWTYRNTGDLVGVTYPRGYGSEARELRRASLGRAAEVDVHAGFIFAKLEPSPVSLADHLGRAAGYLERFASGTPGHRLSLDTVPYRYSYQGNWKLQVENTVDAYHPSVTHRSFYEVMARRTGADRNPYASDDGPVRTRSLGNGHGLFELGKARTHAAREGTQGGDSYFDRARTAPDGERLVAEIQRLLGRDEALRLLEPESDFNLAVFPNLMVVQSQLRVVFPVRPDYTEVEAYATEVDGVPQAVNDLRMRIVERFWGPCGFGSPDDLEIFERFHATMSDRTPQWLMLSRGEEREVDEGGETVAYGSDEGPLRSYYRAWVRCMTHFAARASSDADVTR